MSNFPNRPSEARVLRTLKDGYWDRTEVIELPDGSRRVRKRSKGAEFGPWGVESLRREIRYLTTLPVRAQSAFPPVLAAWDDNRAATADVGYEMPFYAEHVDAGELARRAALAQDEIDAFQDALAEAVLARVHEPAMVGESLAAHVRSVVEHAWSELEKDPVLTRLINGATIELNGAPALGPRRAFARIVRETDALAALDAGPCVRLHGDLFLENILWRPNPAPHGSAPLAEGIDAPLRGRLESRRSDTADREVRPPRSRITSEDGGRGSRRAASTLRLRPLSGRPRSDGSVSDESPQLILVDPVSVAGVSSGPPVFDLVKYESYATGELLALRSEWVDVGDPAANSYHYRICWDEPALVPFRTRDWHTRFRRAFEAKHGPVDRRLFRLIDGYFSAAMAVNTGGTQRRARLLKATAEFNAVPANE